MRLSVTTPKLYGQTWLMLKNAAPIVGRLVPRLLNGGNEVEFYQLPKLGDRITARAKYLDIYEKTGRSGTMVFIVVETRYTNQHDELLMISRLTLIRR